jgi:hypothetical protein
MVNFVSDGREFRRILREVAFVRAADREYRPQMRIAPSRRAARKGRDEAEERPLVQGESATSSPCSESRSAKFSTQPRRWKGDVPVLSES